LSFEPKKFDVHALLNDVKQTFSLPELQENVDVKIEHGSKAEKPVTINSDYEKLRQIITNLVSNAFKYTTKGTITVGYEVQDPGIKFFVKDTGIGVPGNEKKKIFDRFYRASNVNKGSIGGTGLGLSIVKELVDLLGGEIWVDDNNNKNGKAEGSVFYFTVN
jgi:signal transduction histidine kinase